MPGSNKGQKFPPEILTRDEVDRLMKATSKRALTGLRNRALIAVGYRAGLRVSEVLNLMPKDVDLEGGVIRILRGKGGKFRVVGIDAGTCALILQWTKRRRGIGLNGRSPLFCTLSGDRLKTAYIRALMPRLARKAGIEKRVHFHALRHSYAWERRTEVTVDQIQAELGHSRLDTTAHYLNHIAPHERIESMKAREWDYGHLLAG